MSGTTPMKVRDLQSERANQVIELLKENCSEFLKTLKTQHGPLMRGMNLEDPSDFLTLKTRPRKTTEASNLGVHLHLSRLMHDAGCPVTRENCYFATRNHNAAKYYGRVYAIYPHNGFKFMWNELRGDTVYYNFSNIYSTSGPFVTSTQMTSLYDNAKKALFSAAHRKKHVINELLKILSDWKGIPVTSEWRVWDENMDPHACMKVLDAMERLMLEAARYGNFGLIFKEIELARENVVWVDQIDPKTVIANLGWTSKSLAEGMQSRHEIMMNGSYYAIPTESDFYARVYLLLREKKLML